MAQPEDNRVQIQLEVDLELTDGPEEALDKIGQELENAFGLSDVLVGESTYEISGVVDITDWVNTLYRRYQDTGGMK
jgi:hypothetical protein